MNIWRLIAGWLGMNVRPTPAPKPPKPMPPKPPPPEARDHLGQINAERAWRGRRALSYSEPATLAAIVQADWNRAADATGHIGPKGNRTLAERLANQGLEDIAAGEISASGEMFADCVDEWLGSAPHRRDMLDPRWTHAGVALSAPSRTGQRYGIVVFH